MTMTTIIKPPYTLTECRRVSKKTMDEITQSMAISKQALYFWENGTNLIPLNQMYKLIRFYEIDLKDVNVEHIVEQAENKKKVN